MSQTDTRRQRVSQAARVSMKGEMLLIEHSQGGEVEARDRTLLALSESALDLEGGLCGVRV
jgi:hypothetical protein